MVQNAPIISPGDTFECHFVTFSVPPPKQKKTRIKNPTKTRLKTCQNPTRIISKPLITPIQAPSKGSAHWAEPWLTFATTGPVRRVRSIWLSLNVYFAHAINVAALWVAIILLNVLKIGNRSFWGSGRPRGPGKALKNMGAKPPTC